MLFRSAAPSLASIAGSNPNPNGNINFTFPSSQQAFALAFAQTVYAVMSAWSASVPAGGQNGWNTLLGNIIGGNLDSSFIPNTNVDIVNTLTVMSKSALRGVPDYTNSVYSNPELWLIPKVLQHNTESRSPVITSCHLPCVLASVGSVVVALLSSLPGVPSVLGV